MKKFLIVFFAATSVLVGQIPTDSLKVYYSFNGNANDESGNGNHTIVYGVILTTDRFGNPDKAYSFNGTDNYLKASASELPTGERTISVWFQSLNSSNKGACFTAYGGNVCGMSSVLSMNNQYLAQTKNHYNFEGGCRANALDAPYPRNPGTTWHHLVFLTSASGSSFYLDDTLIAANTTFVTNTYVNGRDLIIGAAVNNNGIGVEADANVGYFKGTLDDFRIYNRALTETEISSLYHEGGWPLSPGLALSSRDINMGMVQLGQLKDTVITILNTGNDTLKITDITSSSPSLFAKTTSLNIMAGTFAMDTIYFAPVTQGSVEGKLVIVSNAPSSPDTITVTANVVVTGVDDIAVIPFEYSLSQNFPNPFNPATTIKYSLSTRSRVHLFVYNILGQVVSDLVNTEQQAGVQSVVWNANLSSGLYFYRLEATSLDNLSKRFVETKKMLLLR
ncbi:MAG: T9SS type A sorting domain-containing protein [Bacteroidetes bacterium]|nr:T9SS type A sorting domain-containing protein [Bacteroidota bacterium]